MSPDSYVSPNNHYTDVIMGTIASQITSLTIVYSTVYSGADQRKHHGSASLAFVRGIHRRPVNSPHKWPVTRKMFPFDDVIMVYFVPWINNDERHRVWSPGQAQPSGKVPWWASLCVIALDYKIPVFEPLVLTEMGDILQTAFANAFLESHVYLNWFKFRVGLTRSS